VQIGLNDRKIDFDISDKECFGRPAVVEKDELRKDGKKSWKTMKNSSINLYCIDFFFFIVIKEIAKNWLEFLHRPNIFSWFIVQNDTEKTKFLFYETYVSKIIIAGRNYSFLRGLISFFPPLFCLRGPPNLFLFPP